MNILSLKTVLTSVPVLVLCSLVLALLIAWIITLAIPLIERRKMLSAKLKNLTRTADENRFLDGKLAGINSRLRRSITVHSDPEEPLVTDVEEDTSVAVAEALDDTFRSLDDTVKVSVTDLTLEKVAEKTVAKIKDGDVEPPETPDLDVSAEVEKLIDETCNTADEPDGNESNESEAPQNEDDSTESPSET